MHIYIYAQYNLIDVKTNGEDAPCANPFSGFC